jgi:hypothetical protein
MTVRAALAYEMALGASLAAPNILALAAVVAIAVSHVYLLRKSILMSRISQKITRNYYASVCHCIDVDLCSSLGSSSDIDSCSDAVDERFSSIPC